MKKYSKKAQASFFVVLGFLLLVVVIIYGFSSGLFTYDPTPQGVKQQQEMVKASVVNLARDGSDYIIRVMEEHGGYLVAQAVDVLNVPEENITEIPAVFFRATGAPYWQQCQNDISPSIDNVTLMFEAAFYNYILNNIQNLADAYYYSNVSFDLSRLSMDAVIFDDKIELYITLPTMVQGYPIPQPYPKVIIPTDFGRIFNFAKDFVAENTEKRFFEWYTSASILLARDLPSAGMFSVCGDRADLTGEDIRIAMEDLAKYTITHITWWQDVAPSHFYPVASVNGNTYPDLNVRLLLPDGFTMATRDSMHINNTQIMYEEDEYGYEVTECLTSYNAKWSTSYPLVLSIEDKKTGHVFSFVDFVYVDALEPGMCEPGLNMSQFNEDLLDSGGTCSKADGNLVCETDPLTGEESCYCETLTPSAECSEEDLQCDALITVTGADDSPIESASINFGDCYLGKTGSDGTISGKILCGTYDLYINKDDYVTHIELVSSAEISKTYVLHKMLQDVTIYFRQVDLTDCSMNTLERMAEFKISAKYSSYQKEFYNDYYDSPCSQACREGICVQYQECLEAMDTSTPTNDYTCMYLGKDCGDCYLNCARKNISLLYMPSGLCTITAELNETEIVEMSEEFNDHEVEWKEFRFWTIGGFSADYEFDEVHHEYYFNVPVSSTAGNIEAFTQAMKTNCDKDPIEVKV